MSEQKYSTAQSSTSRNLTARQFDQLVNSSQQLKKLYAHAKVICALNEKLHKHLAPNLSSHFNVANYSEETLIVNAESSAWASKLRYCIPDILAYAKSECGLVNLKSVRIGVSPQQNQSSDDKHGITDPHTSLKRAYMSQKSADFIKNVASTINDPALQQSILKLSKNTR